MRRTAARYLRRGAGVRFALLADRGGRRFSQAISEGDGISVIVEVDGADAARLAEADGAEAIVVRGDPTAVRESTELPILSMRAADAEGADACVVDASELDEDGDRLAWASSRGLDLVFCVRDDDELQEVLEAHDPEIFLLAGNDLDHALDLLSDVPVGKLAIVRSENLSREDVLELERRGMDAVIVPPRNVAELVGGAHPPV
jgi:indole-3-glycerol phosphate synthase